MDIQALVSLSGGTPDDNPDDYDIFLSGSLAGSQARERLTVAGEGDVYLGLFLPSDAAFIALAQDLGYAGSDEAGVKRFLLELGLERFDQILSAHWFQALSEDREPVPFEDPQAAGSVTTLDGQTLQISGTMLIDGAPGLPDAELLPGEIAVSNGVVRSIDRVILPFDLPEDSVPVFDSVVEGSTGRDRLIGSAGDDLLIDGAGKDKLRGGAGRDIFVMADDEDRDKIVDFELGQDRIDISSWDVRYFADLRITQRGPDKVLIGKGRDGVVLKAASGTISVEDLGADSFIFGPSLTGTYMRGTDERDRLIGTDGDDVIDGGLGRDVLFGGLGADTFLVGTDARDVVKDFTEGHDRIRLEGWGVTEFSELAIAQLRPGMVEVTAGDFALRIQAADREIAAEDLSAADFMLWA